MYLVSESVSDFVINFRESLQIDISFYNRSKNNLLDGVLQIYK